MIDRKPTAVAKESTVKLPETLPELISTSDSKVSGELVAYKELLDVWWKDTREVINRNFEAINDAINS